MNEIKQIENLKQYIQERLDGIAEIITIEDKDRRKKKFDWAVDNLSNSLEKRVTKKDVRDKLDIYFEFEKNYLDLIREYKEEIKFSNSIQEDLRKERTKFFSDTIGKVSNTLESTLEPDMTYYWVKELVKCVCESFEMSKELTDDNSFNILSNLKMDATRQLNTEE